ncbi:MAG: pyridoxamine 5'-phosphate oxidase family protein [Eubacteriales bacterium]|nr:pyridoxamine 5'-phosphate oxidase family protein [Eubacteriales bacterium]
MNEVLEFLKSCGTFYLATTDGDQPRVRPFGAVCEFEGRLYIVTNNQKDVYKQMQKNSKIEISGMSQGKWIRLAGNAVHDSRREARVAMLEANASLGSMYNADDNLMEVLYIENGTATFCSFTEEPKTINF